MNRLEAMGTFVAAVNAGSLSAASRKLGLPLATVSRRVSDLENYLRTQLLVRTSRKLELTQAGQAYVTACREILSTVEQAEREAAGEYAVPAGEVVVTAPIVFGRLHVLPVILAFQEAFANITVRLVQTDRIAHFIEDHVDVAVRIGNLPDSSLKAIKLGVVQKITCASPGYLAARKSRPEHPADLRNHDCISFEGLAPSQDWTFGSATNSQAVPVSPRLTVNTAEAAIDAAIAGAGITQVLDYQVAKAVASGALEIILQSHNPDPWPVHLVFSGHGLLPRKTRAFIEYAAERLRLRLREPG